MSDGVKFIFKSLIKVPIFITVAFFILNVFSLFFIYFKMLGLSYVVMQTAVENNYLPSNETTQLLDYMSTISNINMVNNDNTGIIIYENPSNANDYVFIRATKTAEGYPVFRTTTGETSASFSKFGDSISETTAAEKVQYGSAVTVGVICNYQIVWPLQQNEMMENGENVKGFNATNTGDTEMADATTLRNRRDAKTVTIPIKITYTVPGLKYYPDLT